MRSRLTASPLLATAVHTVTSCCRETPTAFVARPGDEVLAKTHVDATVGSATTQPRPTPEPPSMVFSDDSRGPPGLSQARPTEPLVLPHGVVGRGSRDDEVEVPLFAPLLPGDQGLVRTLGGAQDLDGRIGVFDFSARQVGGRREISSSASSSSY